MATMDCRQSSPPERDEILPRWAAKISQVLVRRLYRSTSIGVVDDELVDEVGIALYARCSSILTVTEAVRGRVECPVCRTVFARSGPQLRCPECAWELSWQRYRSTYKRRQLFGGGALFAFENYHRDYPRARTARERLLLVDTLIHEYHWNLIAGNSEPEATRPAAACLIEGANLAAVVRFLDELSGIPSDDPERVSTIRKWKHDSENARRN